MKKTISISLDMRFSKIPLLQGYQHPVQTPIISTIADWNPYEVLPLPKQIGNHTSIFRSDDIN